MPRMELTWEQPPTINKGRGAPPKYAPVLANLQERPGEWARLSVPDVKDIAPLVTQINNGTLKGIEKGEYEATSRQIDDTRVLYVRYVGQTPLDVGTDLQ